MGDVQDGSGAAGAGADPGPPRGHPRLRGAVRPAGRIVGALLSLSVLLGSGYGWYQYRSLDSGLQRLHLSNLGQPAAGATPSAARPANGRAQNILIVGLDSRNGLSAAERRLLKVGNADSLSTDTVMVVHVPADGSRATMISIPRDSYVDIHGYLKNKINAAYADAYHDAIASGATDKQAQGAGANLLVGTVGKLTGVRIDHYIQVGFGGFYTIAKALKSIPVTLCAATDDTRKHNEANGLGAVGSGFKMSAGRHDLTPIQAVEFVRQRHNLPGQDLGREKRQRYFLSAAFDRISSAGVLLHPSKLNSLIKAVTGAFYVDDNGFSLVDLANQMAELSADRITGATIPTDGTADVDIAGVTTNVVVVNPAAVRRFVRSRIDPPAGTSTSSTTAGPSVPTTSSAAAAPSTTATPSTTKGCVY